MKKSLLKIVLIFIGIFFISTNVYASSITLINKSVPSNIYLYDTLNYGKEYYDFNFTFKALSSAPNEGTPEQIGALVYFEAFINGKSVDLSNAILTDGENTIPVTIKNNVMYVINIPVVADYKTSTIKRTVRIQNALISSITKENNVPLQWKIYNAYNNSEIYANGSIKLADDPKDPPVAVTPKIGATENNQIYKLLVPLPGVTCMDNTGKDKTCIGNNVGKYLDFIFKFGIGLCAALAVLMLIIYGITYMGDESVFGKTEAKHKMLGAITGLIIAIGGWVLLNTINPDITGKNGLTIDSVGVKTSGGGYYGVTIGSPSDSGPGGGENANTNVTTYDAYLKSASSKYGLQCNLLKAFMYAESGGRNGLTSPDGAQGLIQLMPGTFAEQNVGSDPMDPQTNINAAASYLSKLKTNGCNGASKSAVCDVSNIQFLAASYNGGPKANTPSERPECPGKAYWNCPQTICNDKTDCFKETRIYAPRVEANFNKITTNGWGC